MEEEYTPLVRVFEGRLYCRRNERGQLMVVGVISLPKWMPTEALVAARLKRRLRLAMKGQPPQIASGVLGELEAGSLLASAQFESAAAAEDALQLFVRKTALPDLSSRTMWVYVIGTTTSAVPAIGQDGLYEIGARPGLILIDSDPLLRKQHPGQILQQPLWGPQGAYGLAHSMEPESFHRWSRADRQRTANQTTTFAKFSSLMAARGPKPLYYTREQMQERESASSEVMTRLQASRRLGHSMAKLDALNLPPLTDDEVEAAVQASRRESMGRRVGSA